MRIPAINVLLPRLKGKKSVQCQPIKPPYKFTDSKKGVK